MSQDSGEAERVIQRKAPAWKKKSKIKRKNNLKIDDW